MSSSSISIRDTVGASPLVYSVILFATKNIFLTMYVLRKQLQLIIIFLIVGMHYIE